MQGKLNKESGFAVIVGGLSLILGVVNNLFIYKNFLELVGFIQSLLSLIGIFSVFALWGLIPVITKYGARLKKISIRHLIKKILRWFLMSFIVFTVFYWLFLPVFFKVIKQESAKIDQFYNYQLVLYFLVYLNCIRLILVNFSVIDLRVFIPNFIEKLLFQKILIPIIVLTAAFLALTEHAMLINLLIASGFIIILHLIYLKTTSFFQHQEVNPNKEELKDKELFRFGTYGVMNELGSALIYHIDIIMVSALIGNKQAGLYAIFTFLARIVLLPISSLGRLFYPVMAKFFSNGNMKKVDDYHKRCAAAAFMLMLGVFILVLSSFDYILGVMNLDYQATRYIFLFLGIGIMTDGLTYLNGTIIEQSDFFQYNLFFLLFVGVGNVILTYLFVTQFFTPEYGIAGVALASCFSLIMFNLLKSGLIYVKLKIHPFSLKTLKPILFAFIFFGITYWIEVDNSYLGLLINGFLFFLLYLIPIYILKLSQDVNNFVDGVLSKIKLYV